MRERALVIGAGRSGRGMLGELYHACGYHVVFADVKGDLVEGLNRVRRYGVRKTSLSTGATERVSVDDFEAIDTVRDHDRYINALATTTWVSTALMPEAFEQVASDVAEAARVRLAMGRPPEQFITLGANYVGLERLFLSQLAKLLGESDLERALSGTHLVMSIVNRKNLLPDEPDESDPYLVIGDDKPVLRVEDIPELRARADRPAFFVLERNLDAAMAIKIWSGNLVQCTMAFAALSKGYTGTREASWNPLSSRLAYYAGDEGYRAVAAEYGLPPRTAEERRRPVELFRTPSFNDSLLRIVRDPIRKLARNDRLIGPALCCMRHGILPYFITRGCAYAFLYGNESDPQAAELQEVLAEKGIDEAVWELCQLDCESEDERVVHDLIVDAYLDITQHNPMDE